MHAEAGPESSMQRAARLQEEFRELRLRLQGLAEEEQRAAQEQHAVGQPAEERRARQEKLAAASQKLHSLVDALSMWESYE
jgi:hypothetical protein